MEKPARSATAVPSPVAPPAAAPGRPRTWSSEDLLGEAPVALIHHAGRTYQLRRTRTNKLILT